MHTIGTSKTQGRKMTLAYPYNRLLKARKTRRHHACLPSQSPRSPTASARYKPRHQVDSWPTLQKPKHIQASRMLGAEGSKQNNVQLHTEPRAMKPGQAVRQWFAFCGRADRGNQRNRMALTSLALELGSHSQGDAIPSNRPQPIGRHGDCIKELTSTSKTLGGSF